MFVLRLMFIVFLYFGALLAETYGLATCDEGNVRCESDGACIPHNQLCDGEIDCADGSDEFLCPSSGRNMTDKLRNSLPIVEAAHYLLSQRKADYAWDDFTARALIGLAFAEKYLPIPEKEKESMMKRLDLQLLFLLKDGVENLATLALHISALYAMCRDPRDFHGIDLVRLLRSETDKAMETPDFNLPIVFLTLCIAGETKDGDFNELLRIYDDKRNNRLGVKALMLIAMYACNRQARGRQSRLYDKRMRNFIVETENSNMDVYTTALICQAYNTRRYDSSLLRNELLSRQAEDGSFGDLLGTYSAIPALLNTSLADLQCKTRSYEAKPAVRTSSSDGMFKPERQIDYSLWITSGENGGFHTLRITFEGQKSFYDLMKMAAFRNPLYRFKYEELKDNGKMVYNLAGVPNDVEKESTWTLYRQVGDRISDNATSDRRKETYGVDKIFPKDGDHFIFQLENGKM